MALVMFLLPRWAPLWTAYMHDGLQHHPAAPLTLATVSLSSCLLNGAADAAPPLIGGLIHVAREEMEMMKQTDH